MTLAELHPAAVECAELRQLAGRDTSTARAELRAWNETVAALGETEAALQVYAAKGWI